MKKLQLTRKSLLIVPIALIALVAVFHWHSIRPKHGSVTATVPSSMSVGQTSTIPIIIDTNGATINAAEVYLRFNPSELEVKAVSKEPSLFQLWIKDQPSFSNQNGTISFAGGLPTPGFSGRGQIGSVTLQPRTSGRHMLTFDPKTRILKNDGLGTAVPMSLPPIIVIAR